VPEVLRQSNNNKKRMPIRLKEGKNYIDGELLLKHKLFIEYG